MEKLDADLLFPVKPVPKFLLVHVQEVPKRLETVAFGPYHGPLGGARAIIRLPLEGG